MDREKSDKGTQIRCPRCGKTLPVRILDLEGKLALSVRCPDCKRVSKIELQDIS